jgi:hypothetical protein
MRWLVSLLLVLSVGSGLRYSEAANAAQCRDAAGTFVKCPKVTHCRNDAGRYVKCGTPGSHPA